MPIIPFGTGERTRGSVIISQVFSHEMVPIFAKKEFLFFLHIIIWYITGNTLHWNVENSSAN